MGVYDAWGMKGPVTVPDSVVSGSSPLIDFPMLITADTLRDSLGNPHPMFDADGTNPARSDGGDFRLTYDEAGTIPIPVDIVSFSINNDPELSACEIHAKIPTLYATQSTTIWVWYNKPDQAKPLDTDSDGRNAVWADYAAVYHGSTTDVTGGGVTLTAGGDSAIATGVSQWGGNAFDVNKTNFSQFSAGTETWGTLLNGSAGIYASAWIYPDTLDTGAADNRILDINLNSTNSGFILNASIGNTLRVGARSRSADSFQSTTGGTLSTGSWQHIAGLADYANDDLYLWEGGANVANAVTATFGNTSYTADGTPGYSDAVPTGDNTFLTRRFNGQITEVRLRSGAPANADDWIATEYNNQSSPGTFATAGTPESVGAVTNTLYYVVYDSALAAPLNTDIVAGNDVNGNPAADSGSVATSVTATVPVSGSGLTAGTSYRVAYWHSDADPADVEVSAPFTTASAVVFVASGGAQSGGTSDIDVDWIFAASGAAQSGGAADVQVSSTVTYEASGGALSAGEGIIDADWPFVSTGGATSGGAAEVSVTGSTAYTGSGGAQTTGAADLEITLVVEATGGMQSAGIATLDIDWAFAPTGGAQATGTADVTTTGSAIYTGAGGAQSGGAAVLVTSHVVQGSGGALSLGIGVLVGEWANQGSGGAQAAGDVTPARGFLHTATGGGQTGGTADVDTSGANAYTGQGGGQTTGTAGLEGDWNPIGTDGTTSSGTAAAQATWAVEATGGATAGGQGLVSLTSQFEHIGTGGASTGGEGFVLWAYSSAGGGQSAGSAALLLAVALLATGSAIAGGSASIDSNVLGAQAICGDISVLTLPENVTHLTVKRTPGGCR